MSALLDQAFDNLLLLPAWFHAHFGPNSPPLAEKLVALQSFLLTWIVNLVTGDPTAFFLYITLPVLMLSAFFRRDKELKKAEETKEKAVVRLAQADAEAIQRANSLSQATTEESERPFVSTKGKDGTAGGRGQPAKRNKK